MITLTAKDGSNINLDDIKHFIVTGQLYKSNKRFRDVYSSWMPAMSINLWRGSVWAELNNGKRKLLKRVWN
jgi:hypothetical protein